MLGLISYNQRAVSSRTLAEVQKTYRLHTEHQIPLLEPRNDWRRRICTLAASLTCIDTLRGYCPVGHDERIAQALLTLSSFHLKGGLQDGKGEAYEQWLAFSRTNYENDPPTNDVMYQAVGCIALGAGLAVECISECDHATFMRHIADGGTAAISCDNRIIPEVTNPSVQNLRPDRHLVAVLGINQTDETITIYDPYFPDKLVNQTMAIPMKVFARYTPDTVKGIAFASSKTQLADLQQFRTPGTLYPEEVIQAFQ